jgi:hypothetical protein
VEFNQKENNLKTLMMYRILAGVYEMRQNWFHGASQVIIFKKRERKTLILFTILFTYGCGTFLMGQLRKQKTN